MPTYDYRCAKCGEDLEVFQTFAEAPLTKHKGCGGKLSKVMSPAGIVLKGSGFYKTDNRDSSSKRSAARDKESKDSNGKSADSGSSSTDSASKPEGSSSGSGDSKSSGSADKSSGSGESKGSGASAAKKPAAKSA